MCSNVTETDIIIKASVAPGTTFFFSTETQIITRCSRETAARGGWQPSPIPGPGRPPPLPPSAPQERMLPGTRRAAVSPTRPSWAGGSGTQRAFPPPTSFSRTHLSGVLLPRSPLSQEVRGPRCSSRLPPPLAEPRGNPHFHPVPHHTSLQPPSVPSSAPFLPIFTLFLS